jgi:uncharacterized protein YciI
MSEWIYFIHAPRDNFAATMTDDEMSVFAAHFARLTTLLHDGVLIVAGPTLGPINTGIVVYEAPDEVAARKIMDEDPVLLAGYGAGELREFRVSLLRGRT